MTPFHALLVKPATKLGALAFSAGVGLMAVRIAACTPAEQQALSKDESALLKDTPYVCDVAQAVDPSGYVTFACTVAEALEEASVGITQLVVRVPSTNAPAFAAAHARKKTAAPADAGASKG